MMLLPLPLSNGKVNLLIILEADNIQRITEHDPAEIKWEHLGQWQRRMPETIGVTYASAEDMQKLQSFLLQGKSDEALKLLTHGWKFRPEMGDHDKGPVRMTGNEGDAQ